MDREEIIQLIQTILSDHGVPRRIKLTLEESLAVLNGSYSHTEKISHIIAALDDASSNPNLSIDARANIWNIVSALEGEVAKS